MLPPRMSSILLEILPEIQENIFHYCTVTDLNNISLCNSIHYKALKEILWSKVTIPLSSMMLQDFLDSSTRQRRHLIHTKELMFHVGMLLPTELRCRISCHYVNIVKSVRRGNLKRLYLDEAFVDNESLRLSCELLPHLKTFSLVGYNFYKRRLKPKALESIENLRQLTELNLHGTRLDDVTLDKISSKLSGLVVLDVGGTHVTDVGVGGLIELQFLEKLVLSGCWVGEEGIRTVSSMITLSMFMT